MAPRWLRIAAAMMAMASFVATGCHLALGLETAETIDESEQCGGVDDCDDGNPCTTDSCETVCIHTELDDVDLPREEQVDGDCLRSFCNDGVVQQVADETDVPIDEKTCTNDVCNGSTPVNEPVAGGTPCSDNGGSVCSASGDCVECHSNADCNSPDTCGGGGTVNECGCTPTQSCVVEGLTCGFLSDTTCGGSIDCNNSAQDGAETDVDCGGPVSTCSVRCANGKACMAGSDCASGNCSGANVCIP